MAKPSSIPRKTIRANYSQKLPSSPLRAHTSTRSQQETIAIVNRLRSKGRDESHIENRVQGDDDDDDDFNPFTSHKSNKFSPSPSLTAPKSQNSHQQAESSLWLFDEDGRADSTNIMQAVAAPWSMVLSDDEGGGRAESENASKKTPSKKMKNPFTAPLPSPMIRVLSPANDLASNLLCPTHKLSRQSAIMNNSRKPLSSLGIPPFNSSSNTSTSISKKDELAQLTSSIASPKETIQADCPPSPTTFELQQVHDATRGRSVQPPELSLKPLPPSAIKKPRGTSADPLKSIKKTRFDNLDENLDRHLSSSPGPLQTITDSGVISVADQNDAPYHLTPVTRRQDTTFASVSKKAPATFASSTEVPLISTSMNQTTKSSSSRVPYHTSESKNGSTTTEVISLLNSSPAQVLATPLSPDRTLASRLQPSQSKNRSSRPSSVEISSDEAAFNNPSQKIKAQNLPLSSFKRLSRTKSTNSNVFQTIQTAPVVALKRSTSTPNAESLRPSRIIRNLASLTGASEDDVQVYKVVRSFARLAKKLPESSNGISEPHTITANVEMSDEQRNLRPDEHDLDLQLSPPLEKPDSFKRQKVSISRQENSLLNESEGILEVKPIESSQDSTRHSRARGRKPTNRFHLREKVGPRLSALIELPTPNSTVEAIGSEDIEGTVMKSNLSMLCQNGGVPQFSTPHSAGPIRLPLPPDTHQLPTSRPRRSCRKSSVRPSPLNPVLSPLTFGTQSSPSHSADRPVNPHSANLLSHDITFDSLPAKPDLVSIPSTNVADCMGVQRLKPFSNSNTPAPLTLSLNSNDSTNTTSSAVPSDKQNPTVARVPSPQDAIESVECATSHNSLATNDANPLVSKKRTNVQVPATRSHQVEETAETRSSQRRQSVELAAKFSPPQRQQGLQGKEQSPVELSTLQQTGVESLTLQETDGERLILKQMEAERLTLQQVSVTSAARSFPLQVLPSVNILPQTSNVTNGKRPSKSNDDRAAGIISKRPRVLSSSLEEYSSDPNNLSRAQNSGTRSSSFPHKPLVSQPRTRVNSQAARKPSLSKAITGTSFPTERPELMKSSDNTSNPSRQVVRKASLSKAISGASCPIEGAGPVKSPDNMTNPSRQALRKASLSKAIAGASFPIDGPEPIKSSDDMTNPSRQAVRKALSARAISGASFPIDGPERIKSSDNMSNPSRQAVRKASSAKAIAGASFPAETQESIESSDNSSNPSAHAESRTAMLRSNKSTYHRPEPPLLELTSLPSKLPKEVVEITNSLMPAHDEAIDLPASGRFTICLGVPSLPTSALPIDDAVLSERHDAQPTIPSEGERLQPIPTSGTQETQRANLHSSGDKSNAHSRSAQATNCAELPILTLPKEFAFTIRSTIPAKPRIKDARKQPEKNSQATSQKQTVIPSAKVPGYAAPKSKPLVRLRPYACDNERAPKRPRNNRSTLTSPSRSKVGPSRPGVSNRVRNTVNRLNSLTSNVTATEVVKKIPASHNLIRCASLQSSRNPPPPNSSSASLMPSTLRSRVAEKTSENVLPMSKNAPETSQGASVTAKKALVTSHSGHESGDVIESGLTEATSVARRLLMQEIRQKSKFHMSPPGVINPRSSQSTIRATSTKREKKGYANQPLAEITENASQSAIAGGIRRVASGGSSCKAGPINNNLRNEPRLKNQLDKNARVNSTGFQNRLNQWREVEAQQSLNSSTQSNKFPEWQDVSLVHHVLPVKDHSKPKKPAMRFGLATERRILERENWEQIKANKDKIEAEIKAQEEMKARELEREEFIKMRRECVVKANPVPDYIKKNR